MVDALIGWSGFVGSTLLRQRKFDRCYRSNDISEIRGRSFGLVVCAAAPAQKWIANRQPDIDRLNLEALMTNLEAMVCDRFVLISTVDVFPNPWGIDESSPVDESGVHAYGLHRRALERFVEDRFAGNLTVRLPGLVGPGLRKNVVFDLLNGNNLGAIDGRGTFQFYPMVNLWYDISIALKERLSLVHLTASPIRVSELATEGFGMEFNQVLGGEPAQYDMRSLHADLFGGRGAYQYSRRESLQAVRAYAQSEPRTLPPVQHESP